ncbi:MAG: hypothetical protein V8Q40_01000 [Anaerosacchariphilus sp.]
MSENRDFDFCPRCGALMQDGVCRSCGYSGRFGSVQQPTQNYGMGNSPKKKKTKGWVIILSILGAILLISALIAVTMNVSRLIFHAAQDTVGSSDYYDD